MQCNFNFQGEQVLIVQHFQFMRRKWSTKISRQAVSSSRTENKICLISACNQKKKEMEEIKSKLHAWVRFRIFDSTFFVKWGWHFTFTHIHNSTLFA